MTLIPNHKIILEIIHNDSFILAVDKPAGLPVYPLKACESATVANALVAKFPELAGVGPTLQAGIVHRLDNDTSGLLVAAKTNAVYDKLRSIWNTENVVKKYTALVVGIPSETTVSFPVAHAPAKKKKMIVCKTPERTEKFGARKAQTRLKKIGVFHYMGQAYTLVSVNITTGVRHQIRVHMASTGNPVAGDRLYQNAEFRKKDILPLSRQFLHLSGIDMRHPETGKKLSLLAGLPGDLKAVIKGHL